jgi:type VI secretion system protein ImpM
MLPFAHSSGLGVVGKLPSSGDFVRLGAHDEAFVALEAWLIRGMEWALERGGSTWAQHFSAGRAHAFVFQPVRGSASTLVGAVMPSQDSAGRHCPVAVAAPLQLGRELAALPQALPLLLERQWQLTGRLAAELRAGAAADLIASAAAATDMPVDPTATAHAYDGWTRELSQAELWSLLFPTAGLEGARAAMRVVLEAIRVFAGVEQPETKLTLRLPLGAAAGAAVCLWLDVVRRALRWRSTVPSFFWSHDGVTGELVLHLGTPPASAVSELWQPTRSRDEICDITLPPSGEHLTAIPELPAAVARAWNPNGTVADLLDSLIQR